MDGWCALGAKLIAEEGHAAFASAAFASVAFTSASCAFNSISEVGDESAPGAQIGSAAYVCRSIEALLMLGVAQGASSCFGSPDRRPPVNS